MKRIEDIEEPLIIDLYNNVILDMYQKKYGKHIFIVQDALEKIKSEFPFEKFKAEIVNK